jgi:signal transduction histidine kinase
VNVESLIGTRAESLFVDAGGDAHGMPAPVLDRGERMTFERRMRRADGEEWVAMVSLTPRMRANAPDGMVAVFTDLTAIKQTATALELARDRAQDASRLKSEFLAMMSHEIRTPLNAILGMNELLLDTPLDAKQRELAQIAFDSSQALMSVINDVLDFSRIEAGKLELGREPLNISDTVSKAADMLRRKAEEKALFLDVRLDRHLPAMVIGDAGRLRQVLVNLIGNSLKFTQVGGVVVTADVTEWRSASIVVRFKVQDTGIGLSEAIRDRLFEPFTQGSSFMTRRHGGTGLGLAICRRIVELMNGEITADGAPGDGATFSFTAVFDVPASEQK